MADKVVPKLILELLCSDIKASLDFYMDVLGFSIMYQRLQDGFAMLEREGVHLMLEQFMPESERVWVAAKLERPFGRGMNLQIETTQIDMLYAKVQNSKAELFLPLEEKWYPAGKREIGQRQFIAQDPDGYLLRFCMRLESRSQTA